MRWISSPAMKFFALLRIGALLAFLWMSGCSPVAAQAPQTDAPSATPADPTLRSATGSENANSDHATALRSPMELGLESFHLKNFDAAATKFAVAALDPAMKSANAWAWLARAQLHLHKLDLAEAAARKAMDLAPDSPSSQTALAEVYFRQAKLEQADAIVRKLVQQQSSEARAYLLLARIYWATANNRAAKSNIDAAHRLDPEDPDIYADWVGTLPPRQRLEEWKKRLAKGVYEDQREQERLVGAVKVLADEEKLASRSCALSAQTLPTESKLEPLFAGARSLRGYGLLVKVNDATSKLLIDTGSSGILINSKIAEKAGVTPIADEEIGGIGDTGAAKGYVGFARRLQIGGLTFDNCYVDVVDKKKSLGEDGLIGSDVFSDFLVDLDFPNGKLRLSELPAFPNTPVSVPGLQLGRSGRDTLHNRWTPPAYSSFLGVYRFAHILLIPGLINHSSPKLFLIDTGSWDNFITPAAAKGNTKIHSDADTVVKGLSGKVENVYVTGNVSLTFGHFQQKRDDMVALDLSRVSDDVGAEISGSLGFAMLYLLEIKIDYRDHLVDFSYDPNRFH